MLVTPDRAVEFASHSPIDLLALLQTPEPREWLPSPDTASAVWPSTFAVVLGAEQQMPAGDPSNGKPLPPPGNPLPAAQSLVPAMRFEAAAPNPRAAAPLVPPSVARPQFPSSLDQAALEPVRDPARSLHRMLVSAPTDSKTGAPMAPQPASGKPSQPAAGTIPGHDALPTTRAPLDAGHAAAALSGASTILGPDAPRTLTAGTEHATREDARAGAGASRAVAPGSLDVGPEQRATAAPTSDDARSFVSPRPPSAVPIPMRDSKHDRDPGLEPARLRSTTMRGPAEGTLAAGAQPLPVAAAPQAAGAPPVPAFDDNGALQQRLADAVANHVRYMVDQKLGEARINLQPPELGSLEIKISFVDDKAHVQMVAQHAAARDALEQGLPRLRELLAQGGLDLGNASVAGGNAQQSQSGDAALAAADRDDTVDRDSRTADTSASVTTRGAADDTARIDLYA